MTIASLGAANPFIARLQAQGLSAAKARVVDADLTGAVRAAGGSPGATTIASVRGALDTRIAADVLSGKLSRSDAAAVKKTLDDIGTQPAAPDGATASASGPVETGKGHAAVKGGGDGDGGGGKGGGGGSAKTEVSETVTVAGSVKTTVITYTDGTTATTTTVANDADRARYDTHDTPDATATARAYLATIEAGSLVDRTA